MNENPWLNINFTGNEYYAQADDKLLREIIKLKPNWIKNGKSEKGVFLLAEAINGNFENSKVILLLNNPGFDKKHEYMYFDESLRKSIQKCLREDKNAKLVYVNNEMKDYINGYKWYTNLSYSFKRLLEKETVKETREWLENNLCVIEWFGYHTNTFNDVYKNEKIESIIEKLPTHQYAIELVEKAIREGKIILSMRDHKRWIDNVKGLKTHSNFYSYIGQNINAINEKSIVKFNDEKIFHYQELKDKLKKVI